MPKIRQCIYCLNNFSRAQITDDHIIAGSWYPDTTPSTVQRWTAPACQKCNNYFSPIERYVHARLAACIDTTHPAAAGMWEKAKRSIDPTRARNHREREHRLRQWGAFLSEIVPLSQPPAHTLPFSIPNFSKGSRTALTISGKKLNSLIEKWVRGIYYKIHGHPLSSSGEVSVVHLPEGAAAEAFGKFWDERLILDAGPGICVSSLSAEEGSNRADVYEFKIWDQFKVFAKATDVIQP